MKNFLIFVALLFLTPLMMASSCKDEAKQKCAPETICTMMFAAVTTSVTNASGEGVKLDEVYTVRKSTSEIISYENQFGSGYIVLDDSYRKNIENATDSFQFIGKIDDKIVVDELFVIGADCCHVKKVSGKTSVVIN